jgi:hypothetical protein
VTAGPPRDARTHGATLAAMPRAIPILALVAACSHWVKGSDELKPGECAAARAQSGGTCTEGSIESAVIATATVPADHGSAAGATIYGRYRLVDFGLDVHGLRRLTAPPDPSSYLTVGGDLGVHLPLVAFSAPKLARYFEVAPAVGADLGLINFSGEIRPRADAWFGGYVEITAPDFGPFQYTEHGVPGLHVGLRRVAYVQGWEAATVVDVGLVWRWGEPIEIHSYEYYKMSLD